MPMILRLLPVFLLLPLATACGTADDGTKTIKIADDATVGDDAADASADATATDVSTLDVKAWPDGIAPDSGFDASLAELSLQDAVLEDGTDQGGEDTPSNLDVKSWPDGIQPDAGPDALIVDIVVDIIGFDVTGSDTTADSSNLDVKSLPDAFGGDAGPDIQVDIAAGDTGKDSGGSDVQVNCAGPNGCYACPPSTLLQFLNQCNTLSSASFDNKARLPLLNADGSLPPLP